MHARNILPFFKFFTIAHLTVVHFIQEIYYVVNCAFTVKVERGKKCNFIAPKIFKKSIKSRLCQIGDSFGDDFSA